MEIRHECMNPGVCNAELHSKAVTVGSWKNAVLYVLFQFCNVCSCTWRDSPFYSQICKNVTLFFYIRDIELNLSLILNSSWVRSKVMQSQFRVSQSCV